MPISRSIRQYIRKPIRQSIRLFEPLPSGQFTNHSYITGWSTNHG